jgi:predicted DNA-binding protein (MmcQ/YjbR family)
MTWENLLAYSLAKPGAWQDEPWEGDVVAKVGSKIFAFFGSGSPPSVGLKCGANRDSADEWLARYPDDASVMAYIGRSGWNTLRIGGAIPEDELTEAIDSSYVAVVSKLPKKDRPPQLLPFQLYGFPLDAIVGRAPPVTFCLTDRGQQDAWPYRNGGIRRSRGRKARRSQWASWRRGDGHELRVENERLHPADCTPTGYSCLGWGDDLRP